MKRAASWLLNIAAVTVFIVAFIYLLAALILPEGG